MPIQDSCRYQSSAVWKTTSTTSLSGHGNEFTSPLVVRDNYRQSSLDRHFGTSRRQLCGISVTCMHCSLCKPLLCHKLTSLRRKASGPRSQLARFSSCSNFWSTHNNHINRQTKQLLLALQDLRGSDHDAKRAWSLWVGRRDEVK